MKPQPLYKLLAQALAWQTTPGFHAARIGRLRALVDMLPSGSGWDLGTVMERAKSTPDKLVLSGSFHHMDADGFYVGWTDHTIIVTASLEATLNLRITGRNRNGVKDYLHDVFMEALMAEVPEPIQ